MPICPSSVHLSVRPSVKIEGGGVYLRNTSVTFLLFSSAVPPGSGAFQMPTHPSASTLRGGGGGKGQSQKRFSNFFSFFGMKLL